MANVILAYRPPGFSRCARDCWNRKGFQKDRDPTPDEGKACPESSRAADLAASPADRIDAVHERNPWDAIA